MTAVLTAPMATDLGPGVIQTVGGTPLVPLDRLFAGAGFRVFAKLEGFNPGGSVKDRTALSILRHGIQTGNIVPGLTTVVESTSGNLGIALAQFCGAMGIGLVLVTDPKTTQQNLRLLQTYGAEVEVVTDRDPDTGEYLPVRLRRVQQLLTEIEFSYWPNQYGNPAGAAAHRWTMQEIWDELDGRIDYLYCTAGTCGTLRGCAEFLHDRSASTVVVAVDAVGSAIFGDAVAGSPIPRRIPGHGSAIVPPLMRPGLADRVHHVTDAECVAGCYALLRSESLLAGGSSGAALAAVARTAGSIRTGSRVAVILPDRGDRYLDTVYSPSWVTEMLGGPDRSLRFPGGGACAAPDQLTEQHVAHRRDTEKVA